MTNELYNTEQLFTRIIIEHKQHFATRRFQTSWGTMMKRCALLTCIAIVCGTPVVHFYHE